MSARLDFDVYDTPRPQGSKRYVGHGVMVESGGQPLRNWREAVKQAALDAIAATGQPWQPIDGPVSLFVTFWLPRPSGHYRTGRNAHLLRDAAPEWPHRTPDLDKLLRSLLDAMSAAGVWVDDARVCHVSAAKGYCTKQGRPPGAEVRVGSL